MTYLFLGSLCYLLGSEGRAKAERDGFVVVFWAIGSVIALFGLIVSLLYFLARGMAQ